ncbi:hypothetical protein ACWCO0_26940 [Streptomyces tubercidicus]
MATSLVHCASGRPPDVAGISDGHGNAGRPFVSIRPAPKEVMREHEKTAVEQGSAICPVRPAAVPAGEGLTPRSVARADDPAGDHGWAEALTALQRAGFRISPEDFGRLSGLLAPSHCAESPTDEPTTPADDEPTAPTSSHTTLLSAERGIINTGSVHGGQHLTDMQVSGDYVRGADDGI